MRSQAGKTDTLCQAAKRSNAYVVMGINERDAKYEGRMYNSILFISPQGEVLVPTEKSALPYRSSFTIREGMGALTFVYMTPILVS